MSDDRPRKRGLRSFKPQIPLPRNGKKCSLERHYSGALRQLAGILDELASHDPERFVWATESYLASQCRNYRREKRTRNQLIQYKLCKQRGPVLCSRSSMGYRLRVVQYCKAILREHGIIGDRAAKERLGIRRTGFIVAKHDDLARISGKICTLSAASSAVPSAVPSAVKKCQVCGRECGCECGVKTTQQPSNEQDAATAARNDRALDRGLSPSILSSSHPVELSEPTAVCVSQKTGEPAAKDSSSTEQDGVTAVQVPVLDLEEAKRKIEEQKARLRRMYPEQFAAYDAARQPMTASAAA